MINHRLRFLKMNISSWINFTRAQAYYLIIYFINQLHSALPFYFSKAFLRICKYKISRTSTVHSGVIFFHFGRLIIGENSIINRNTYLDNRGGIRIGSNVNIAHDVKIYTLGHDPHDDNFSLKAKPVIVEDYAVIFAGAMIMPGVTLGNGSVVMAGSVVTKSVPPMTIVGGNPAKHISNRSCHPKYKLNYSFWKAH